MAFRPCIDIHNGKVKQIVGATLQAADGLDSAKENFVAPQNAAYFADLYREKGLRGGHVIMLNRPGSEYYEATLAEALAALEAFPGGLQLGGGVRADNAERFLAAGASHVIVTSYVFSDGAVNYQNLEKLRRSVGRERIVLDLSCRRKGGRYYIVTDRWTKFTGVEVTAENLAALAEYCAEYLVHAVDVEGRAAGVDEGLAQSLGAYEGLPVTYAGGVASLDDIEKVRRLGQGRLDFTVGSALNIFGGGLALEAVLHA
ncbi:MAG: phosphoribosylformimino-5-aminoimidazole carboxamide ribotide isomerase [Lachnospiraceae bacterium]|jgi:phosphoribosylformimino-5-aminoimidazole carboxamide ribotide isomerase|nr:phosphoribosylformimino-5-aminoimidazole carboxamide ribotide isomerase [Lachnospiraceae bacterium]